MNKIFSAFFGVLGKDRNGRVRVRHLPLQEKINFARHLSIMIKAGLPLLDSLKIIRRQSKGKMARLVDEVTLDISNGQFLADSLSHYPAFGDFFVSVVRVGEASGTLAENLGYLADEMKKSRILRSKIRSAMVYPIVILVATIVVTALLTFVVFPKVMPIFTSLNIELPLVTVILIKSLTFIKNFGGWLLLGFVVLIIGLKFALRIYLVRLIFSKIVFLLPVVSKLSIHVGMANFTRILGILLKSGVKIVEALTITSNTFNNLIYRQAFLEAADEVRRGEQFAHYLMKNKHIFPPLLGSMVEIGENTGSLESNLLYLSEYYTEEVDISVRNLTTMLEPLMLVVMGLIVGFVALSIILPIYKLTQI